MKNNIIQEKSYKFAIRIVKLYQFLCQEKSGYTIGKQLLRSGTSVGANVEEAIGAQSHKDFIAKLSIAYKEARETHFWLRLLTDTDYLTAAAGKSILKDCEEMLKILASILKTAKSKPIKN